jgi:HEAT repeat protein
MARYDLNQLNSQSFTELCNALLHRVISERVTPGPLLGRDAGVDAWYEGAGKGDWTSWDGAWIFQYKFHNVARQGVQKCRRALQRDAESELEKVFHKYHHRADNYILITNVPCAPTPRSPSRRWLDRLAVQYAQDGLQRVDLWDLEKLNSLLDVHRDLLPLYLTATSLPTQLPSFEHVAAHRAALAEKPAYCRWADEFYLREEGKILPLFASPYDDTGQEREDLLRVIRTRDRLLVLGQPGMGKTVALQRMMWDTAQAGDLVVPIFVPLLFFRGDLLESVRVALNETGELRFDDPQAVRSFLREMTCLLMFDGLNEVPGERREAIIPAIADFVRDFPSHRYVVTSRSQDSLWKKLRTSGVFENAVVIHPITDDQVRSYLAAHLPRRGQGFYEQLDDSLRVLSRTPLLLWLIKEAGLAGEQLPGNRGELFDRFVTRMLGRDVKLETKVPPTVKRRALVYLAFALYQEQKLACTRERAAEIIAATEAEWDSNVILDEVLVHGLLLGEQQVSFLHQSVQEHFVGLRLCEIARDDKEASLLRRMCQHLLRCGGLATRARDGWWAESFVQMSGLFEDPSWLVREIARVRPWLAFWCAIEGRDVDPKTRGIVEAKTTALLHSRSPRKRLQATRELSHYESPRTIGYLLEVLDDEDGAVVRVASQALARLGTPAVEPILEMLLHSTERACRAATQVLGRIWEFDGLVQLGDGEADVRLRAVKDLGELGDSRAVRPLVAAFADSDNRIPDAVATVVDAFPRPDVMRTLIVALTSGSAKVRQGAITTLGRLGGGQAMRPLVEALRSGEKWMRIEAAAALAELSPIDTTEPLIAALGDDEDDVRQAAARALGRLGTPGAHQAVQEYMERERYVSGIRS